MSLIGHAKNRDLGQAGKAKALYPFSVLASVLADLQYEDRKFEVSIRNNHRALIISGASAAVALLALAKSFLF